MAEPAPVEHAQVERVARRTLLIRAAAIALGTLILGLVCAVVVWGGASSGGTRLIGQVAPEISGRTLDGDRVDLDDWRGRWVVVNFFAPWCAECIVEYPELSALARELGDEALVVSVAVDTSVDDVRAFLERRPATWPVVMDPKGRTAVSYGQAKVPETYLVAPDSTIAAKFDGAIEARQLVAAMTPRAP